jgi:hypothetical protein
MPDEAILEYYKLAAQIMPVLWLGTALQRLDPTETLAALERVQREARELDAPEVARPLTTQLQRATDVLSARITRVLALLAIALAVLGEALALYGVAADYTATWATVLVTVGLAMGGALLFAPVVFRWMLYFRGGRAAGETR